MVVLKLKPYFFLVGLSAFLITSCNRGEQTKRQIIQESSSQESESDRFDSANNLSLTKDSLNLDLLLSAGSDYYLQKEYGKAINQFLAANKIDPNNLKALIGLGNLYYDTQQYTQAINFYEKALAISPNNLSIRCDLATCYSMINMLEKAIEINLKTVEMDFSHVQSHHNLAVFYKQQGKETEAARETKIYNELSSNINK